jgi:hypothetical protein
MQLAGVGYIAVAMLLVAAAIGAFVLWLLPRKPRLAVVLGLPLQAVVLYPSGASLLAPFDPPNKVELWELLMLIPFFVFGAMLARAVELWRPGRPIDDEPV